MSSLRQINPDEFWVVPRNQMAIIDVIDKYGYRKLSQEGEIVQIGLNGMNLGEVDISYHHSQITLNYDRWDLRQIRAVAVFRRTLEDLHIPYKEKSSPNEVLSTIRQSVSELEKLFSTGGNSQ